MRVVARVGDHTNGDGGDRRIDPRDIVPITRRTYVEGSLIAVYNDWTKAPHHDWERLRSGHFASRTSVNGLPVAVIGSKDTGDHTVIEGASRTFVG